MKIQAQSSLLLRQALQKAAKCIDSKTAIAILSNVKSENCSDLLLSSMMIPEYESMSRRLG